MNTNTVLTTIGVCVIALAITVTFIVADPASLVSKSIACGGITVATLGGVKTLLEILKLKQENERLVAEREREKSPITLASSEDIDRYVVEPRRELLTRLIKSSSIGILLLIVGFSSWAAVMLHQSAGDRNKLKTKSDALVSAREELDKYRKRIQSLEDEIRGLQHPQQRQSVPRKTTERPGNLKAASPLPGPPTLIIQNGFKAPLQVSVSGPTSKTLTLTPGQKSEAIPVQVGDYVISAQAPAGFSPMEDQKISVTEHSSHSIILGPR